MKNPQHWLMLCLTLGMLIFFGCVNLLRSNSDLSISLPIDCQLGKDCFIFHYVDTNPSSEAIDFNCGRQTYNDHTGTDFGITNLKEMEKGVKVIAVASGTVKHIQDGVIDKLIVDQTDKDEVSDRACGNGILIDHGKGWKTEYCHLKQGSILVSPDTKVKKGTPLGLVGSSGMASFPHVHLTIFYQNKIIDPFTGKKANAGCKVAKKALWTSKIDYQSTGLINAGFAPKPPKPIEIWQGEFLEKQLSANSPALVFWVHLYGILQGDIESFTLINPKGKAVIQQKQTVKKSYRNWVTYVGQKNNLDNPIMSGIWQGKYQLKRNSNIIFEVNQKVEIMSTIKNNN
ncbi:Peptidase M23 [Rippkaea orientalis PCC 8801]|uniref:Peptidase M23 n=1 Tax=Rippkaea orientalis (strain PCC 8801 / RF-1) TaxID=41431 RepID=B7K053_RIPO1|nr:M23 family metallopeptidase [Rippkaea orientalis]ACK66200.1 Peptidase M23 [Rippkaea orientalis PCC 8801]